MGRNLLTWPESTRFDSAEIEIFGPNKKQASNPWLVIFFFLANSTQLGWRMTQPLFLNIFFSKNI